MSIKISSLVLRHLALNMYSKPNALILFATYRSLIVTTTAKVLTFRVRYVDVHTWYCTWLACCNSASSYREKHRDQQKKKVVCLHKVVLRRGLGWRKRNTISNCTCHTSQIIGTPSKQAPMNISTYLDYNNFIRFKSTRSTVNYIEKLLTRIEILILGPKIIMDTLDNSESLDHFSIDFNM